MPGCACVHVCFTDAHAKFLKAELVQRVFGLFQKEGHAHYQPSLASLLGKKGPQKKPKTTEGDDEAGKTAVGKAKAKGKAKPKPEAKGKDNGNDDRAALLAKLKKLQGGGGGEDAGDGEDPDGEIDEEEGEVTGDGTEL